LNVTVPVGVPPTVEVTVAVNVTDWPSVDGLRDELKRVVEAAVATAVTDVPAVLLAKTGSNCTPVTCELEANVPGEAAVKTTV
jgi:hypothetical protein